MPEVNPKTSLQLLLVHNGAEIAKLTIKAGAAVWITWIVADAFVAGVGADTNINVFVRIGIEALERSGLWLPWLLVALLAAWGLFERRLRKQKTEELQERNVELEKLLDPNRESSNLLPSGDTNPEDKL